MQSKLNFNNFRPTGLLRTPLAALAARGVRSSAVEPATPAPMDVATTCQRSWDDCCQRSSTLLLNSAVDDREKARLRASLTDTSGAWLQALPISSVGLRMDDYVIRVAVESAYRH